jgi:hypothetical protein
MCLLFFFNIRLNSPKQKKPASAGFQDLRWTALLFICDLLQLLGRNDLSVQCGIRRAPTMRLPVILIPIKCGQRGCLGGGEEVKDLMAGPSWTIPTLAGLSSALSSITHPSIDRTGGRTTSRLGASFRMLLGKGIDQNRKQRSFAIISQYSHYFSMGYYWHY